MWMLEASSLPCNWASATFKELCLLLTKSRPELKMEREGKVHPDAASAPDTLVCKAEETDALIPARDGAS